MVVNSFEDRQSDGDLKSMDIITKYDGCKSSITVNDGETSVPIISYILNKMIQINNILY